MTSPEPAFDLPAGAQVAGLTYLPVTPRFVEFFQARPRTSFAGFLDKPLLSASASLDTGGSRHHYRIERMELYGIGDCVAIIWAIAMGREPVSIHGVALAAASDSPEERAFIEQVLGHVLDDMARPLRSMLAAIEGSGLAQANQLAAEVRDKPLDR